MLIYARQIFKTRLVHARFISETKSVTPNFFYISETSNSFSLSAVEVWRKSIE